MSLSTDLASLQSYYAGLGNTRGCNTVGGRVRMSCESDGSGFLDYVCVTGPSAGFRITDFGANANIEAAVAAIVSEITG